MLKRIFILFLALCLSFSFIAQPVSAVSPGVTFTVIEVAKAVAGAFGIVLASDSSYLAFGNDLHQSLISTPGPAASEWWNRSLAGNIILTGLDATVKSIIWGCASKVAHEIAQAEQVPNSYTFTATSYSVDADGNVLDSNNYTNDVYTITHSSDAPPVYFIEYCIPYRDGTSDFGAVLVSAGPFKYSVNGGRAYSVSYIESYGCYYENPCGGSLGKSLTRHGASVFSSWNALDAHLKNLAGSSGASSVGGATAAYSTHGFDGVSLPNIDLTQPGLIAEDGTSTISNLIDQLKSGAISWEDFIGTVAPGQTATITLTDADGATVTYTLTNTGVGEKVETGTEPGDETIPVVIPPGSEIATNDIIELLKLIASTVTNFMNRVVALLQSIYDWGVELGTSIRTFFETVIKKIQAFYDAVVEWFAALKDAVIQLGIQIGEFIANGVETIVTTVKTWLQWVVEQLLAGLQALGKTIVDAITAVFVPTADFITAKVDALRARFNFADSIIVTGEAIRDALNGFGSEPPIIYAELANSRGKYDWGVRAIALDLTWYSEYKPTVDGIISSFLWLMFAWKMFVKLSGIINGAGSDAKYVMMHERKTK